MTPNPDNKPIQHPELILGLLLPGLHLYLLFLLAAEAVVLGLTGTMARAAAEAQAEVSRI